MLASLGASPTAATADLSPVLVDPIPAGSFGAGLPGGVMEHCTGLALALGALAGAPVSALAVATQVRLPEVMAAAYGSSNRMRPAAPRPAGGGWLHADLGAGGDGSLFETLLSTLAPSPSAAEVASAAQQWRLPVCDYRPRPSSGLPVWSFQPGRLVAAASRPPQVLDLTNMWAGPLATWLLASLGWRVTKVEPSFRPDGFRALDGGGIHPDDRQCDPGHDSAMWNSLNHGKEIVDLDLRVSADRNRLVELATASDVVIDSFSPRVMPNFGLAWPEGPLYVSVPAFPPGPRRDWVAYGTGIHAASGLGDAGGGRFAAPAVSYPDPVGGFTAALATAAALDGRHRGIAIGRVDCPLLGAVQPLLAWPAEAGHLQTQDGEVGARLLEVGRSLGRFEARPVCGQDRAHPAGIFPPGIFPPGILPPKQNVF